MKILAYSRLRANVKTLKVNKVSLGGDVVPKGTKVRVLKTDKGIFNDYLLVGVVGEEDTKLKVRPDDLD